MIGVDAKPIMATMADHVVVARSYSVLDAVDQSICGNLPPMEADLSWPKRVGNDAIRRGNDHTSSVAIDMRMRVAARP